MRHRVFRSQNLNLNVENVKIYADNISIFLELSHKMKKVNISEKLKLFSEFWQPKIVGELNGQYVKLAKLKGEFVWHSHEKEDELFLVLQGQLIILFRDKKVVLNPGEFIIVPKGVEHKPIAPEEVRAEIYS